MRELTMTIQGDVPSKSNCYKIITLNGHGSLAKQKVLKEYESKYGPLFVTSDATLTYPWAWNQLPWPWENK